MKKRILSYFNRVYTTGYQGKNIDEFLNHLVSNDVEQIVDVREIPLSRKKGFSKNMLRQRLADNNIDYVHFRTLGSPSNLRKKVYSDGDFDYFFKHYEKYLDNCSKELKDLYEAAREKLSCLLCFEENPINCHRSSVANRVSKINGSTLTIKHI